MDILICQRASMGKYCDIRAGLGVQLRAAEAGVVVWKGPTFLAFPPF